MASRLDTDARRQQLLALGLELFDRHSYESLSIDTIASEAGISKGLLYHYFPGKRAFYIAVVDAAAKELVRSALFAGASVDENATPLERLTAGVDAYLDFAVEHADSFRFLLRSAIGHDDEIRTIVERCRQLFAAQLLEDGGDPLGAVGLVAFAESVTLTWLDSGDSRPSRKHLRELIVRVATTALTPQT